MDQFPTTYVLLRPAQAKAYHAGRTQFVHGHEVLEHVGEHGGIILNEVVVTDHPNYPIPMDNGQNDWRPRKVKKSIVQWFPDACSHCGIVFDKEYVSPDSESPKRRVCAECHRAINWQKRKLFVCEPARWDAERLVASQSTDPPWQFIEVRTADQLAIYTGATVENFEWDDEEGDDTADAIEARASEAAKEQRSKVPQAYRDLQKRVGILAERGAPVSELSRGKISPADELRAFIAKYEESYGRTDAALAAS